MSEEAKYSPEEARDYRAPVSRMSRARIIARRVWRRRIDLKSGAKSLKKKLGPNSRLLFCVHRVPPSHSS